MTQTCTTNLGSFLRPKPQPTTGPTYEIDPSSMSTAPSFHEKLQARIADIDSFLIVGLDPHSSELPEFTCDAAFTFCKNIILATRELAVAYKPNAAFFEALGDDGMSTLRRICALIPKEIPILLDVKRGDIGTTAIAYASACYDHIGADAVTLSPLMGMDSIEPFITGTMLTCWMMISLLTVQ